MDALLGAAGLGDIGQHFPPGDPLYKDASSLALLARVAAFLAGMGYAVGNIDATVVAERPRLAPFIPEMRRRIAATLAIPEESVGGQGHHQRGLGPLGANEGIAAGPWPSLRR